MTGFARLIISLFRFTRRANGLTYLSCSTKIQPLHPFFHLNICMIYSNMPHPHHMIYLILLDIFTFIKVFLICLRREKKGGQTTKNLSWGRKIRFMGGEGGGGVKQGGGGAIEIHLIYA